MFLGLLVGKPVEGGDPGTSLALLTVCYTFPSLAVGSYKLGSTDEATWPQLALGQKSAPGTQCHRSCAVMLVPSESLPLYAALLHLTPAPTSGRSG